jgi:8-oxo-dGTP pyrophosphatase MutT (NUDIX family)
MTGQSPGRYVGPYSVLHSRPVYENPWLKLREDRVRRQGQDSVYGVVTMKAGVTVLPVEPNGDVYLVREFKYALGDHSLEAISGSLESGETPDQAGLRELSEECGLAATEWIDMGRINPFTTIVHSPNHMFLARGLVKERRVRDPGEVLEVVRMPLEEAFYAVLRGGITHGASCVLILKAKLFLEHHDGFRK